MLRVEEREEISSADAHKLLSAFTKSDAMLPGDMFFQLQRVHAELHVENARLRASLEEQLAVCHCDAVATLRSLLAPVPALLTRAHDELHAEAQRADALHAQAVALVRALSDEASPAPGLPEMSGAEWQQRLAGLLSLLGRQGDDRAAGHEALRESLRSLAAATSDAVAQAEAQAGAMLAVLRSLPTTPPRGPGSPSGAGRGASAQDDPRALSALYLAAWHARLECEACEGRERALAEQLAAARRQAAHGARLSASRAQEAALHRRSAERQRKHLARAAEREAGMQARAAEAARQAAARERALGLRLVRAQRTPPPAAPSPTRGVEEGSAAAAAAALWGDFQAAKEQAEGAVRDARFELGVEASLRAQLQARNEQLAGQLRGAGAQPRAEAAAELAAAVARLADKQSKPADEQPPRPAERPGPRSEAVDQPPDTAGEVDALVEQLCASVRLDGGSRVSQAELGAFLCAIDRLHPLGHEPRAKAAALCRDFGDGGSVPIGHLRAVVAKLARGSPADLRALSDAWAGI